MKYLIPTLITLLSFAALAASEAGHDDHSVPTQLIVHQAFNVVIIVIGLVYFVRKPLRQHFQDKRNSFLNAAQKAAAARKEAEEQRMEIQVKLNRLESTADESVARARAEAADMKKQLIAEAEALSKRIREEAEQAARLEVEKAKRNLRETLIKDSLSMARSQLSTKVTAEDHQRLQTDFLSHIQAVQK
ncbi:MAG: hypothetical protein ACAH59_01220 [Pseudobdellovibrionaceae bacterium]